MYMHVHMVMSSMSVTEARAALPDVPDRVIAGEEVTITRHGQPVAVIVRPETMRARRATPQRFSRPGPSRPENRS